MVQHSSIDHTGLTGVAAFGSNSNAVSQANAPGASGSNARADHVHMGVRSIAHSSNTFTGPVILTASGVLGITSPTPGTINLSAVDVAGSGGGGVTVQDEGTPLATTGTTLNFVGSGVTASGTGATKTITIAGGGGSTDTAPLEPAADPDADDDEGTGADTDPISGWTTLGTITLDRDTTIPDHIYMSVPAFNNPRIDGIYKSHALANGEAFVARLDGDTLRAGNNRVGIFIGVASAAGRIDTVNLYSDGNLHYQAQAFSNTTTLTGGIGSTVQIQRLDLFVARDWPVYLAIRRNTSTSYDFLYGYGTPAGIFWTQFVSARDPSFTQDVCGLFASPANPSTDLKAIWKWARFYATLPAGFTV